MCSCWTAFLMKCAIDEKTARCFSLLFCACALTHDLPPPKWMFFSGSSNLPVAFYLFSCRALCICLNHAITPLSLYLYVRIINSQNPAAAAQPLACIANSGVLACYLPLASSTPCPWGILNRINLAGRELIKAEILCCFLFFFATLQRTWGFNGVLPAACWSWVV